ncbi:hypothetical protein SRHO_G00104650 [Serrasalmus rhombeus]
MKKHSRCQAVSESGDDGGNFCRSICLAAGLGGGRPPAVSVGVTQAQGYKGTMERPSCALLTQPEMDQVRSSSASEALRGSAHWSMRPDVAAALSRANRTAPPRRRFYRRA